MFIAHYPQYFELKGVLMGIPNSDLLGVTMAVIHVAGQ